MVDLFRIRAFTAQELTEELPAAVDAARDELISRYHPGTVRRLGGPTASVRGYIQKLLIRDRQDELAESGRATYAVAPRGPRPDGMRIVGLATLSRHVKSQHARLPIPTGLTDRLSFASGITSPRVELGQVNGTGWTVPGYGDELSDVYRALGAGSAGAKALDRRAGSLRSSISQRDSGRRHACYGTGATLRGRRRRSLCTAHQPSLCLRWSTVRIITVIPS